MMNTGARQRLLETLGEERSPHSKDEQRSNPVALQEIARHNAAREGTQRVRVFVAAENRLLREALSRMIGKLEDIEVVGQMWPSLSAPRTCCAKKSRFCC
jgi:hypothetical protein